MNHTDRPELTVRGFVFALIPSLALWAAIVGVAAHILH